MRIAVLALLVTQAIIEVDPLDVVPGDLIFFAPGSRIHADCRLIALRTTTDHVYTSEQAVTVSPSTRPAIDVRGLTGETEHVTMYPYLLLCCCDHAPADVGDRISPHQCDLGATNHGNHVSKYTISGPSKIHLFPFPSSLIQ